MKALRNLVQYQNILNTTAFDFIGYITLFCQMLKLNDNEVSEIGEQRLKVVVSIIFDILKNISKSTKFCEFLLNNKEFNQLIIRTFLQNQSEREIFDIEEQKKMIAILENIFTNEQLYLEKFLAKDGVVMYLLHIIFESNFRESMRIEVYHMLKQLLTEIPTLSQVVDSFIPIPVQNFIHMVNNDPDTYKSDDELISDFLKTLDGKQHIKIKQECERIISLVT